MPKAGCRLVLPPLRRIKGIYMTRIPSPSISSSPNRRQRTSKLETPTKLIKVQAHLSPTPDLEACVSESQSTPQSVRMCLYKYNQCNNCGATHLVGLCACLGVLLAGPGSHACPVSSSTTSIVGRLWHCRSCCPAMYSH